MDRVQGVPVVGGGDDHRVDIVTVQEAAVILVRVRAQPFGGGFGLSHIDISHGRNPDILVARERAHVAAAHHADANAAKDDPVVCPRGARAGQYARRKDHGSGRGGRGPRHAVLQKTAPCLVLHRMFSPVCVVCPGVGLAHGELQA